MASSESPPSSPTSRCVDCTKVCEQLQLLQLDCKRHNACSNCVKIRGRAQPSDLLRCQVCGETSGDSAATDVCREVADQDRGRGLDLRR